jgi:hypothetical protein
LFLSRCRSRIKPVSFSLSAHCTPPTRRRIRTAARQETNALSVLQLHRNQFSLRGSGGAENRPWICRGRWRCRATPRSSSRFLLGICHRSEMGEGTVPHCSPLCPIILCPILRRSGHFWPHMQSSTRSAVFAGSGDAIVGNYVQRPGCREGSRPGR